VHFSYMCIFHRSAYFICTCVNFTTCTNFERMNFSYSCIFYNVCIFCYSRAQMHPCSLSIQWHVRITCDLTARLATCVHTPSFKAEHKHTLNVSCMMYNITKACTQMCVYVHIHTDVCICVSMFKYKHMYQIYGPTHVCLSISHICAHAKL
jgi:hypothetical protein